MRLTPRDLTILDAVHRYRLLRSTHIVALSGGSRQPVLRRLGLLFHHGYLDRPASQLSWYKRGSEPLVYALGRRGPRVLGLSGKRRPAIRWDTKNQRLSRMSVEHALLVSEVMAAFEVACREQGGGVQVIPSAGILADAPAATRRLRLPFRWQVDTRFRGRRIRLGIQPDAAFGLRADGRRDAFFFLEADRGTMPVARRSLARTSFARKLIAYEATARAGLHRGLYGIPAFRVLTVTTSAKRMAGIAAACREIAGHGSRRYLFATASQVQAANLLAMPWVNGRGEPTTLLTREERRGAQQPVGVSEKNRGA